MFLINRRKKDLPSSFKHNTSLLKISHYFNYNLLTKHYTNKPIITDKLNIAPHPLILLIETIKILIFYFLVKTLYKLSYF